MTGDAVSEDQLLSVLGRAIDQCETRTAEAIALALRTFSPRRQQPSFGLGVRFGRVVDGFPTYANVRFDNETDPVPVQSIGTVASGTKVAVLIIPPSAGLILGSGVGGGGGGVLAPVLAEFSASGVVIPTTTSKLIPIGASDTITSVAMTMGTPPLTGRQCAIDVQLNGSSIGGSPPLTFLPDSVNPLIFPVTPAAGPGLVTCIVNDGGSGRDLGVFVMSGGD